MKSTGVRDSIFDLDEPLMLDGVNLLTLILKRKGSVRILTTSNLHKCILIVAVIVDRYLNDPQ